MSGNGEDDLFQVALEASGGDALEDTVPLGDAESTPKEKQGEVPDPAAQGEAVSGEQFINIMKSVWDQVDPDVALKLQADRIPEPLTGGGNEDRKEA